jgi:hypothetical protein
MFEAVAGYLPFRRGVDDENAPAEERWPQMVEEPAPLPRQLPDLVAKPILSTLDKDPANRPAAGEFARLLEPIVATIPKPVLGGFKPKLH